MKRQVPVQSTNPEQESDATEVQGWLDYFRRLTPREIVVHMYAAQAAADIDPGPECQEGACLTLAILRLHLTLDRERKAA